MFGRIDEYAPSFMANQIERSSAGSKQGGDRYRELGGDGRGRVAVLSLPPPCLLLAPYAQSIGNRVLLQQA